MNYPGKRYLREMYWPFCNRQVTKQFSNCPVCGKQRVNIYKRGQIWKCLKCWQKEVANADTY